MKCPFCGLEASPIYFEEREEEEIIISHEIENAGYCQECEQLFTVHSHDLTSGGKD